MKAGDRLEAIRDDLQTFRFESVDNPHADLSRVLDILVKLVEEVQRIECANKRALNDLGDRLP